MFINFYVSRCVKDGKIEVEMTALSSKDEVQARLNEETHGDEEVLCVLQVDTTDAKESQSLDAIEALIVASNTHPHEIGYQLENIFRLFFMKGMEFAESCNGTYRTPSE